MTREEIDEYICKCPYFSGAKCIDRSILGTHIGSCSLEFHHKKICPSSECICAGKFGLDRKARNDMTREEALVQLRLGPGINEDVSEEYNEAVDMAIEVLEQQPNGDCISRKETIDALKQQAENMLCWSERYAEQRKGILTAINIVSDLLSVTPQPKTEGARGDIPLQQSVPKMPQPSERTEERTETYECDCISRKDIGLTNLEILMCNGDYKEALKMLLDKIEKTPSVNPQQKTGHWIEHKSDGYTYIKCSECSCYFPRRLLPINNYCPYCGAKMQEVQQ